MALLETTIDDIVGAYQKFSTISVICCALQSTNVVCKSTLFADQIPHININPLSAFYIIHNESLDLLKHIHAQAVEHPDTDIAKKWKQLNIFVCPQASVNGSLDLMQWGRTIGCPWDACDCSTAAIHNHLELLQWMHANGCDWDYWTCNYAAANGHLDLLRRACANGCPHDEWACINAATYGRLEVLKYLRGIGCPWNAQVWQHAINNGDLEMIQWLRNNNCPQE